MAAALQMQTHGTERQVAAQAHADGHSPLLNTMHACMQGPPWRDRAGGYSGKPFDVQLAPCLLNTGGWQQAAAESSCDKLTLQLL